LYFIPDPKASTVAVKDLGRHLTSKEFFSDVFFTQERLEQINEIAKPMFNYGIDDDIPDDELFDIESSEIDVELLNGED
jgi:hypothetical protein